MTLMDSKKLGGFDDGRFLTCCDVSESEGEAVGRFLTEIREEGDESDT